MKRPVFLRANWNHLILCNFEVDPGILEPYIPPGTLLDDFQGKHWVSIVAFQFEKTKLLGVPAFFHQSFEEINLRFYVKRPDGSGFKRGTVFISEIVPKKLIPLVANRLYNENYRFLPMKHHWADEGEMERIRFELKPSHDWNRIEVLAEKKSRLPLVDSFESFIVEHYWGYNKIRTHTSLEYGVEHPSWELSSVKSCIFDLKIQELYGSSFEKYLNFPPSSVFLARGSDILIRTPTYFQS